MGKTIMAPVLPVATKPQGPVAGALGHSRQSSRARPAKQRANRDEGDIWQRDTLPEPLAAFGPELAPFEFLCTFLSGQADRTG